MAVHVDRCPIQIRVWNGKPYANMVDDCVGCEHMMTLDFDAGVICDGFRARGIPSPPAAEVPRPPPEAFEGPEEDPVKAAIRWTEETRRSDADAIARVQQEARIAAEGTEAMPATGDDQPTTSITSSTAVHPHGPHKGDQRPRPRLPQRYSRGGRKRRVIRWREPL